MTESRDEEMVGPAQPADMTAGSAPAEPGPEPVRAAPAEEAPAVDASRTPAGASGQEPEAPARPGPAVPPAGAQAASAPPPSQQGAPPFQAGYAPRPGVPPRPPRPGRAWLPWVGGGCLGCLGVFLFLFLIGLGGLFGRGFTGTLPTGDRVGLIYIEGPIMGGRGAAGLFGVSGGADDIMRQLDRARRDHNIKAVVLRINSPGGSAAASQEIHEEIMRLRKARKPVIVSMGDVAASGGYYVASAADKIVASGSTMTGSIGVIMEFMNLQGLYRKIGFDSETIKSGQFKDIGSSDRPMTAEERRLLQEMVNDVYDQFVDAVADGRKGLSREQIRRVADGRIFTGRQALKLKLVDSLGNLQDAIALAGKSAGIVGRPTVVEIGRRSFLDYLSGSDPEFDGQMRLPSSSAEEERLIRALRRLVREQALLR